MIGMEMGQEHVREIRQADRRDQLPLRALTAVEQDPVSASAHQHRRQSAAGRRGRTAGAGEEDREVHWRDSLSGHHGQLDPGPGVADQPRSDEESAASMV